MLILSTLCIQFKRRTQVILSVENDSPCKSVLRFVMLGEGVMALVYSIVAFAKKPLV